MKTVRSHNTTTVVGGRDSDPRSHSASSSSPRMGWLGRAVVVLVLWTVFVVYVCSWWMNHGAPTNSQIDVVSHRSGGSVGVPSLASSSYLVAVDPTAHHKPGADDASVAPTSHVGGRLGNVGQRSMDTMDQQLLASLERAAQQLRFSGAGGRRGRRKDGDATIDTSSDLDQRVGMSALEVASTESYDPTNVEPDESNMFR